MFVVSYDFMCKLVRLCVRYITDCKKNIYNKCDSFSNTMLIYILHFVLFILGILNTIFNYKRDLSDVNRLWNPFYIDNRAINGERDPKDWAPYWALFWCNFHTLQFFDGLLAVAITYQWHYVVNQILTGVVHFLFWATPFWLVVFFYHMEDEFHRPRYKALLGMTALTGALGFVQLLPLLFKRSLDWHRLNGDLFHVPIVTGSIFGKWGFTKWNIAAVGHYNFMPSTYCFYLFICASIATCSRYKRKRRFWVIVVFLSSIITCMGIMNFTSAGISLWYAFISLCSNYVFAIEFYYWAKEKWDYRGI